MHTDMTLDDAAAAVTSIPEADQITLCNAFAADEQRFGTPRTSEELAMCSDRIHKTTAIQLDWCQVVVALMGAT